MSTSAQSPTQSKVEISHISETALPSQDAAPSPLHAEAVSILGAAPKFGAIGTLGGGPKAGKEGTADQILQDADYAEKSLINPSEKIASSHNMADVFAPKKQEPSFDKAASALVIQDGKEYLNLTDPYSATAKAAANRALGIA